MPVHFPRAPASAPETCPAPPIPGILPSIHPWAFPHSICPRYLPRAFSSLPRPPASVPGHLVPTASSPVSAHPPQPWASPLVSAPGIPAQPPQDSRLWESLTHTTRTHPATAGLSPSSPRYLGSWLLSTHLFPSLAPEGADGARDPPGIFSHCRTAGHSVALGVGEIQTIPFACSPQPHAVGLGPFLRTDRILVRPWANLGIVGWESPVTFSRLLISTLKPPWPQ